VCRNGVTRVSAGECEEREQSDNGTLLSLETFGHPEIATQSAQMLTKKSRSLDLLPISEAEKLFGND